MLSCRIISWQCSPYWRCILTRAQPRCCSSKEIHCWLVMGITYRISWQCISCGNCIYSHVRILCPVSIEHWWCCCWGFLWIVASQQCTHFICFREGKDVYSTTIRSTQSSYFKKCVAGLAAKQVLTSPLLTGSSDALDYVLVGGAPDAYSSRCVSVCLYFWVMFLRNAWNEGGW